MNQNRAHLGQDATTLRSSVGGALCSAARRHGVVSSSAVFGCRWWALGVAALLTLSGAGQTGASPTDRMAQKASEAAEHAPGLARVEVWAADAPAPSALGTAFEVRPGVWLTAWHVVTGAVFSEGMGSQVRLSRPGQAAATEATLVAFDAINDLALLAQAGSAPSAFAAVRWARANGASSEPLVIAGYAEGRSLGSTEARSGSVVQQAALVRRLLLHGAGSPGQSGGPVLRLGTQPEVVGVVVARGFLSQLSQAVPAEVAEAFVAVHGSRRIAISPEEARELLKQQLVQHQEAVLGEVEHVLAAPANRRRWLRDWERIRPLDLPCWASTSPVDRDLKVIRTVCTGSAVIDTADRAATDLGEVSWSIAKVELPSAAKPVRRTRALRDLDRMVGAVFDRMQAVDGKAGAPRCARAAIAATKPGHERLGAVRLVVCHQQHIKLGLLQLRMVALKWTSPNTAVVVSWTTDLATPETAAQYTRLLLTQLEAGTP
jgi:hypothetical protein